MANPDFHIEISDQAVSVRLDASTKSPHGRLYALIFHAALVALLMCGLLFLPGKHGNPSMYHDMSVNSVGSGRFVFPLALLLITPFFMALLTWRYVVYAYPSDETFHCDRSTLTISKVRWLDFHNKEWETRFYRLGEIENMRYKALARSKNASVYGIRFTARGETERILPGLNTHQAGKILKALGTFGVDVRQHRRAQKE